MPVIALEVLHGDGGLVSCHDKFVYEGVFGLAGGEGGGVAANEEKALGVDVGEDSFGGKGGRVLWLERRVYEREVLVKHGNGCLGQRKRSKQLMQVIKTKSRPLRAVQTGARRYRGISVISSGQNKL